MPEDNVFRFVSLRAPREQGEDERAAEVPIIAPDDGHSPLDDAVEEADGEDDRVKLREGGQGFTKSPSYFTNRLGAKGDQWFREVEGLVADLDVSGQRFTERAHDLLERAKRPDEDVADGWGSPALKQEVWSSYTASLLAGGERGRETRGLLGVLRMIHGYERASEPGFDAKALALASRRVALPARYLIRRAPPAGPEVETAEDEAATEYRAAKLAAEDAQALMRAKAVIEAAAKRRRKRLAEATRQRLRAVMSAEALERGAGSEGGESAPGSSEDQDDTRIEVPQPPLRRPEPLHHLSESDIDDVETVEALGRFGLDPADHVIALTQRIDELVAAKLAEASRAARRDVVAWERGTFVRIRKPVAPRPDKPEAVR